LKLSFLGLFILSFSSSAMAEYRVFQYLVKTKNDNFLVEQAPAQIVSSNLNPVSFLSYHGGKSAVDITLLRSWMCPGHTGKKDYCPHPSQRGTP
jgi:hypothetical protein